MMNKVFFYLFSLLFLVACNGELLEELEGETSLGTFCPHTRLADGSCPIWASGDSRGWSFSNSANYTFDSNFVEVSGGKASLKTVDTSFSGNEFNNGTFSGTVLESSNIVMQTKPSLASAHVNTILPAKSSNLIGYWRFDGNLNDSSSFGHNGSSTSPSYSADSKISANALLSQNSGSGADKVTIPSTTDLSPGVSMSVSFWMKSSGASDSFSDFLYKTPNASGQGGWTISKNGSSSNLFVRIDTDPGVGGAYNQFRQGSANIFDGEYHHVLVIFDNGILKAYVDGSLDINSTYNVGNGFSDSSQDLLITNREPTREFDGVMDEVAMWNTALSESEVIDIYDAQNATFSELSSSWTPHYDKIIGYYKLNGNWRDSSGNGNHGTAGSSASYSEGKVGSHSASFSGANTPGSLTGLNTELSGEDSFAVSFWTRNTGPSARHIMTGNSVNTFRFIVSSPNVNLSNSGFLSSTLTCFGCIDADNNWYHHLLTISNGSYQWYVNGALKRSGSTSGNLSFTSNYRIGGTNSSSNIMQGEVDDLAFWSVGLSAVEAQLIYDRQKQKYAGHYDSPVIDLGRGVPWTNLNSTTPLPFDKEISSLVSESATHYPSINGDLTNGLLAHWPLNETSATAGSDNDFTNTVSNNYHAEANGTFSAGQSCLFNKCIDNSTLNQLIEVHELAPIVNAASFTEGTFSIWYKRNFANDTASFQTLFAIRNGFSTRLLLNYHPGVDSWRLVSGTSGVGSDANVIPNNEWSHVLIRWSETDDQLKLYVNGVEKFVLNGIIDIVDADQFFFAGANSSILEGEIDEAAFWSRALTDNEIQQLYRRGANRVKYQVKSCIDAACNCKSLSVAPAGSSTDCDGDGTANADDPSDVHLAEWLGHSGADGSTFSELQNCSTVDGSGDCSGDVNDTAPAFTFSDFPAAAQAGNNRYFQYRVLFEAEENTACSGGACLPELTSVEVGPTGRFYGGAPTITSVNPEAFSSITSMNFTEGGSCSHSYQLSRDGANYYYHNGTSWTLASGANLSESSNSSTTSANISTFASEVGVGSLYFKAFLNSDTSQSCEVDEISVEIAN